MASGVMATGMIGVKGAGDRNYHLFAAQLRAKRGPVPEMYFAKNIDNSRLVKVADPQRVREIRIFMAAVCFFFVFAMIYTWQHFSAIEYGYRIEAAKQQRDALIEKNHELKLEEASLRDPHRIDQLARRMGLGAPQASQMQPLDHVDTSSGPEMARVDVPSIVAP